MSVAPVNILEEWEVDDENIPSSIVAQEGWEVDSPAPSQPVINMGQGQEAAQDPAMVQYIESIGPGQAALIATGKGMTTMGRAADQLYNVFSGDDASFEETKARALQEKAQFKPLEEQYPKSTFVGEVAGETAAMPFGGLGTGKLIRYLTSVLTGAGAGAATEVGQGDDIGLNTVIGAIAGPAGEGIGDLVSKFGTPIIDGVKRIFQNKGITNVNSYISPEGNITAAGEDLLNKLDVTPEEFQAAFGNLTDASRLEGLSPEAQLRVARAQTVDVPLSEGQATREFGIQSSEDILRNSEFPEGQIARQFFEAQQVKLVEARDNFTRLIGGELDATRTARGSQVRANLREIDSAEREVISNLYDALKDVPGGNQRIRTDNYNFAAEGIIREYSPTDRISTGVKRIFEDFDIGVDPSATVKKSVKWEGPLTFKNAERMRKRLNKINPTESDDIAVVQQLKKNLDDLFAGAVAQVPENSPISAAANKARKAAAENFDRFKAKDVIQNLIDFKKGTRTDKISDERVLDVILSSGNQKIANLKAIKKILGSNPTNNSIQTWRNIQTQAAIDLFGKATTELPDGFVISGAKLNSEIGRIGDEALKEIFDPKQYLELKKLQSIIADVTIPVSGTRNPSGTGARIMNMIGKFVRLPGLTGKAAEMLQAGVRSSTEEAQRELILSGIEKGASHSKVASALLAMSVSSASRQAALENRERASANN